MSSTHRWIPYDSVAPIILKNDKFPDQPFLSGTGFFVVFPPFDQAFFVTARHCIYDGNDNENGYPKIPWNSSKNCKEAIRFSFCLTGMTDSSGDFPEDICVFVIGDMPEEQKLHLTNRAIVLAHQESVTSILNHAHECRSNLRVVGFPSCSKQISYDESKLIPVPQELVATPRGIYGKITQNSLKKDHYQVSGLSWKGGELDGFSGSPVLSLHPNTSGGVTPIVVGVLVTGSPKTFSAVNINVATDLIAYWIAQGAEGSHN